MKKVLLILFISSLCFAEISWFGYYEAEADYYKMQNTNMYFNYNKLRLDFEANVSDRIRIAGDAVYKFYGGQTQINFMDYIATELRPTIPNLDPASSSLYSRVDTLYEEFSDSLALDNIYLEFHHDLFDLTLGRQQIPTGVGYAWNPTDIFNKKDLMDPTYEVPGVDAIHLDIPVGSYLSVSSIIKPQDSWNNSIQYYKMSTYLAGFDISAVYGKTQYSPTTFMSIFTGSTTAYSRDLYGVYGEGDFFGFGLRSEFTISRLNYDNDDLKYEYIVGGDYTFENSLYVLTEYYHNDFGVAEDAVTFDDYLQYYNWDRKGLNQNYLFLMAMYPLGDLLDISISGIGNLDDRSVAVFPQLTYRIFEDVELLFSPYIFIGEKLDEFGQQDAAIRLRLKAWF